MAKQCFDSAFYTAFIQLLTGSKHRLINIATKHELTIMQALTILNLRDSTLTMGDFSKLYACDAGNITGIIDALEQKALVTRRPQPDDKRIKIIQLEPAGYELQTLLLEELVCTGDELFIALDNDERCLFAQLVKKVATAKQLNQNLKT